MNKLERERERDERLKGDRETNLMVLWS
jgi:hypothetical protein